MIKGINVTELRFNDEVPYELVEYFNVETPFGHSSLDKSIIVTAPETEMDMWRVHLCNLNLFELIFLFDLLDYALHGHTQEDLHLELDNLREKTEFLERELEGALSIIRFYEARGI